MMIVPPYIVAMKAANVIVSMMRFFMCFPFGVGGAEAPVGYAKISSATKLTSPSMMREFSSAIVPNVI